MKRNTSLMWALVVCMAFAGCRSKHPKGDADSAAAEVAPAESSTNGDVNAQDTSPTPFGAEGAADPAAVAALSGKIVYFRYDSSEIDPQYNGIIAEAARNLAAHTTWKVRLEGNTDSRGTPEYNIGLGERRAQAVRRALMLQGAADAQVTTVSYGEERPAVEGEDETAFAKNRRVEMAAIP